jgi:hypothetical protein
MRRSYGFRTYRVLELALYHSLSKLREPELTHEFFGRVGKRARRGMGWQVLGSARPRALLAMLLPAHNNSPPP